MSEKEKVDIWMPVYIGEVLAKLSRLSIDEIGAAFLLMMDYWKTGSIPDDNQIIANITKVSTCKARKIKYALLGTGLFEITADMITSEYLDGHKHNAEENKNAKSERGKAGAAARWAKEREQEELARQQAELEAMQKHDASNANAMRKHMQNDASSNAKDVLEGCPSSSSSSASVYTNDAGADGNALTPQQVIDLWKPNLKTVNDFLRCSGTLPITQENLEVLLLDFNAHYRSKNIDETQKLTKLGQWIKRNDLDAKAAKAKQSRQGTKTKPADVNANWSDNHVAPDPNFDREKVLKGDQTEDVL